MTLVLLLLLNTASLNWRGEAFYDDVALLEHRLAGFRGGAVLEIGDPIFISALGSVSPPFAGGKFGISGYYSVLFGSLEHGFYAQMRPQKTIPTTILRLGIRVPIDNFALFIGAKSSFSNQYQNREKILNARSMGGMFFGIQTPFPWTERGYISFLTSWEKSRVQNRKLKNRNRETWSFSIAFGTISIRELDNDDYYSVLEYLRGD